MRSVAALLSMRCGGGVLRALRAPVPHPLGRAVSSSTATTVEPGGAVAGNAARANKSAESGRGYAPRTILASVTPVGDIIKDRGEKVFQIAAGDSMQHALRKMFIHNIGSLLVVEEVQQADRPCKPLGIITERDLIRLLISRNTGGGDSNILGNVRVQEFMTRANALISATPETDLAAVLELMASRRLRHLPIVRGEYAIGMVSVGDVVRKLIEESREEAAALKEYISGTY